MLTQSSAPNPEVVLLAGVTLELDDTDDTTVALDTRLFPPPNPPPPPDAAEEPPPAAEGLGSPPQPKTASSAAQAATLPQRQVASSTGLFMRD